MATVSGWNLWVSLAGSRCYGIYECGCKEVQYVPKNLPCTVRFTLDCLRKMEVKQLLNGL